MSWWKKASKNKNADVSLCVYTVITSEYMQLGLAWAERVREVSGKTPLFICADAESMEFLNAHGFPCISRSPQIPLSATEKRLWRGTNFPGDKALYTVALKMVTAAELLRSGRPVLYSDVDAVWIRNPIPDILQHGAEFVFHPGRVPNREKKDAEAREKGWTFTVCSGFFYLRPCYHTQKLMETVASELLSENKFVLNAMSPATRCFNKLISLKNQLAKIAFPVPSRRPKGCDQSMLNSVLRRDYEVQWSSSPTNWDHCSLDNGWLEPVKGTCRRTKMNLVALPHAYYQHQGTNAESVKHAVVCHPITAEHTQARKQEKFLSLGIDFQNSRFPN